MQRETEKQKGLVEQMKESANLMQWLVEMMILPMLLFWRRPGTAGRRFFGGRMLWALAVMMVVVTYAGGVPAEFAFWMVMLILVLTAGHNQKTRQAQKAGAAIHSYYGGDSQWEKRHGNRRAKALVEPVMTAGLGVLFLFPDSQALLHCRGLGVYLLLSSVCMAISYSLSTRALEAEAEELEDQRIEQEVIARRVRR